MTESNITKYSFYILILTTVCGAGWAINDYLQKKRERIEDKQTKNEEIIDEKILESVKNEKGEIPQPIINKLCKFLSSKTNDEKTFYLINLIDYKLNNKSYSDIFKKVAFDRISFQGAVFSSFVCNEEIYLSGINLKNSNLAEINFSGVPINLSYSNLANVKMRKALLSNSSLKWANLSDADMSASDLSFSDLSNSDLRNTDFGGARMFGVKLENAKVSSVTWFEDMNKTYSARIIGLHSLSERYFVENKLQKDSSGNYFQIKEKKSYNTFPNDTLPLNTNYKHYIENELGLEILLPFDIFKTEPSVNNLEKGTGCKIFVSEDEKAILILESQRIVNDFECLEKQKISKYGTINITYKNPEKPNNKWFVRSGYIGENNDNIFYEKYIRVDEEERYIHFKMISPTGYRKIYDPIINYMQKTFKKN